MSKVFVDASAFVALYLYDDDFHKPATELLNGLQDREVLFVTSNFILDEVYTFIRAKRGKNQAIGFAEFLSENFDTVRVARITIADEQEAFKYFKELPGRGLSYTDCTSFALMKRLGVKEAFAFDRDFVKAGFAVLP